MAVHGSVHVSYATLAEALGMARAIGRSAEEPEDRAVQLETLLEDLLARCEEHRLDVEEWTADRHMDRPPVTRRARELAATAGQQFTADRDLAVAIAEAERQLRAANERLWVGLDPQSLQDIYGESSRRSSSRPRSAPARRSCPLRIPSKRAPSSPPIRPGPL